MSKAKRTMTRGEAEQILSAPLPEDNDSGALTVREYFIELAKMIWNEGESFNGKRPFGNSGWEYDIRWALVHSKIVEGSLDEDGDLEEYDAQRVHDLVLAALEYL